MSFPPIDRRTILMSAALGGFAPTLAAAQPPASPPRPEAHPVEVEAFEHLRSGADWGPAIQAAMDHVAARGGGAVGFRRRGPANFYPCSALKWRNRVMLDGGGRAHHAAEGMAWLRPIGLPANGFLLSPDDQSGAGFGLIGLAIHGEGSGGTTGALDLGTAGGIHISHCSIGNVSREALKGRSGGTQLWHNGFGGWTNTGLITAPTGTVVLDGADNMVCFNEIAGSSVRSVSGPRLHLAAARFEGLAVSLIQGNIFECGDAGVNAWGDNNRYLGNRYDTNAGHGLILRGSGCVSIGEYFGRNAFANGASNLYDHIYAPAGESQMCQVLSPTFYRSAREDGTVAYPRFCINDQNASGVYKNSYLFPNGIEGRLDNAGRPNFGSGFFNTPANGVDVASLTLRDEGEQRRLEESATPSVLLHKVFSTDMWVRPHAVTNFADGAPGQRILLRGNVAGRLVLQAGANLRLGALASPYVPRSTEMLEFINIGGPGAHAIWQIIGR